MGIPYLRGVKVNRVMMADSFRNWQIFFIIYTYLIP